MRRRDVGRDPDRRDLDGRDGVARFGEHSHEPDPGARRGRGRRPPSRRSRAGDPGRAPRERSGPTRWIPLISQQARAEVRLPCIGLGDRGGPQERHADMRRATTVPHTVAGRAAEEIAVDSLLSAAQLVAQQPKVSPKRAFPRSSSSRSARSWQPAEHPACRASCSVLGLAELRLARHVAPHPLPPPGRAPRATPRGGP